ncbi:Arylsulphatase [Bimuria novae-zelandiae CBS 107.79]|uniref:Arylsulfatase n=1 Tax=Bimuria novae-zelandiae CBS 107.79 TaxID=1447943 RepID=A0A6A5UN33_9PLEO|nr:Arylsulphatase [Bimuria novae-zelandiae CBS 107.79]
MALLTLLLQASVALSAVQCASAKQPNILFILTDDQDWHMRSFEHMPFLQKYLVHEGTLYANHFCTVAICCPSRVNLWTGRAAHNTNVTDIFAPYGGYPKVVREGINDDYLPVWMQNAGYNTYYTGKLWNQHSVDNYNDPFARGYNGSDFILDPNTYEYYNAYMSRNNGPPVSYKGEYSPDVTAQKAYGFLEEATQHPEPWFLTIAPIAPHSNVKLEPFKDLESDVPQYAERHAHLFKDYKIPRDANFNPSKQGGTGWIKKLPLLNDTVIEYNDEFQRSRLRALQSVDEMIEQLVKTLDQKGLLDDTYIIYTTDNGYHLSQHRLHAGKECGYDTDIHIPLIVRGPTVPKGHTTSLVSSHTDLAPTIMRLAGATRDDFDGLAMPFSRQDILEAESTTRHEHVNIEFWGRALPEGKYGQYDNPDGRTGGPDWAGDLPTVRNNTYKGLRLIGQDYSIYYSVWCTGDREYYDMTRDPGQLENYFDDDDEKMVAKRDAYELAGRPFAHVVDRLDALMMVLKSCKGRACVEPWSVLQPKSGIRMLQDALEQKYDVFYNEQPKVSFDECALGYIREFEGPQEVNVMGAWDQELSEPKMRKAPSFVYHGNPHLLT